MQPPRWEAILRPQNTQSGADGGEDEARLLLAKMVETTRSTRVYGDYNYGHRQNYGKKKRST